MPFKEGNMRLWVRRLANAAATALALAKKVAAVLVMGGVVAGGACLLQVQDAQSAPLGSPISALPWQSNPVSSYAAPAGYGNLTGADGDVSSAIWALTTDLGYLGYMNGSNSTPTKMIDTGISGLTGVAYLGPDKWALSAGKSIYEGTVSGTTWHTDKTILVTGLTGDLTDVDWTPTIGYEVATQNDGTRKVAADGSSSLSYTGNGYMAIKLLEFKPDTYDNGLLQHTYGQIFCINMDTSGIPFGGSQSLDPYNTWNITGVAYFKGGFAVVQNGTPYSVDIHSALSPLQDNMASIPEPATLALLSLGGALLAATWRKAH
jgi:hypothetical protein